MLLRVSTRGEEGEHIMFMPLEGVRVIDLTHYTAGPYATRILGDYGADVIKIEQPGGGDPARRIGPFYHDEPGLEKSGLFLFLNTNKRSMTLDFKTEKGKQIIKDLVKDADILIENFPPDVMPDAGLGYDELSRVNPRLVMTSISNFGKSGPYRDWVGLDLTMYAMGGNMWGSGDPELEPIKTAGRMASCHVGYAAALATALGLTNAELRGQGENIDVSYFEVTLQSIDGRMQRLLGYQYNGRVPMRVSPGASLGLGSGVYPCIDGMFMTTAGPAMFPNMARMVGQEEILSQPGWDSVAARSRPEAAEEWEAILVPWMLERTMKEVQRACMEFGVLGGPMNTIENLIKDEDFAERGFWQTIDHPATGPQLYPGFNSRIHFDDGERPARRRAPLLGEHTVEILNEISIEGKEVSLLRSEGVI